MARFVVGTPQITREPTITVDAGLPVGRHRFRLEVIDASGLRSAPDQVIVDVQRITGPGPIPTPGPVIRPGPIIPTPGPIIQPGPIIRAPRSRTPRKKEKP